jgi:hypothetical protein
VSFSSSVNPIAVACLNLPAGATCSWSAASSSVSINTAGTAPKGNFSVTVVFTETQSAVLPADILLPLVMFPVAFIHRTGRKRLLRVFYLICLAVILSGFVAACASVNGLRGTAPPAGPAATFTSSGMVSLTIE